jgi:hypothetical protein
MFVLQVGQFGWKNGLATGARHDPPAARKCRREVHLISQKANGFERRDGVTAMGALDRDFEAVDRVEPSGLAHHRAFRPMQTVPLLTVNDSGKI